MGMPWWRQVLVLLLAVHPLRSGAQPEDKVKAVLDGVDAILEPVKAKRKDMGAQRATRLNASLCEREANDTTKVFRDYLCEPSTLVGRWSLTNLPVSTGGKDGAVLEVRRFNSPDAAWTAKATGVERYGGPEVDEIAMETIDAANVQVYWVDDLLFSVQYGFGSSPDRTKPIGAVLDLLEKTATPFEDTGVIGVGVWNVMVAGSRKRIEIPDRARFRHFFKVTGVAANDVLWLRKKPASGGPGEKVGKIPPDATCIPLVFVPPKDTPNEYFRDLQGWVVVKFNGKGGWARRRFLAEQPAEECLPHP